MDEPKNYAATQQQQEALMLPRLTEAEKQSPIGASMGYLMGLFFSLKQQLVSQRAAQAAALAKQNQPVAAVFDAFVSGNLPSTTATGGGEHPTVDVNGNATTAAAAATAAGNNEAKPNAVPSMRSNLEENNMMKREMRNQMAFQNKMRALKMQELKKLKTVSSDEAGMHNKDQMEADGNVLLANAVSTAAAITANSKLAASNANGGSSSEPQQYGVSVSQQDQQQHQPQPMQQLSSHQQLQEHEQQQQQQQQQQDFQGAGEAPIDGGGGIGFDGERNRSMSIGAAEDFWNTDVVDDQLFEFLMNN
jgi:hypothetical protein